jgi:hypothetical protein
MSDSFTTNPTVVDKFYSGPVSLRYTSRNFTNGTSYTLKSSTDTSLGSQTFTLLSTTTFSGPGTTSFAIAADSSGNVYVQRSSNITTMYNSSGSVITTFSLASVISTKPGPDQNTIYFAGSFVFGIFNVPTRTFTSSFNPGLNIWGSVYNPADGLVYVSVISVMDLYKINPTTQVVTKIFTNNGTFGLPSSSNNFFQGCAIANDGNLYCITRNEATIWKFTIAGTSIGSVVDLPGNGSGLHYDSVYNCLYATTTQGNAYRVPLSSPSSYATIISGSTTMWGSYFNPYTGIFYASNGTTVWTVRTNDSLTYTFSNSAIANSGSVRLFNGATPFGVSMFLFDLEYPCFLQGTKIRRFNPETYQEEYVPVETLRKDDLIPTAESGYKLIQAIGHRTIPHPKNDPNPSNRLYTFTNANCPTIFEPLHITGEHCTLHRNISAEKRKLITEHMGDVYITEEFYRMPAHLDDRAEPYEGPDEPATIWHFALENEYDTYNYGVYANGLIVESSSMRSLLEKSGMQLIE